MSTYADSRGRLHVIADMPFTYLSNALAKLEREGGDSDVIAALRTEKATRELAYAEQQAAEQVRS